MKLYKTIIVLLLASLIFFLASCNKKDADVTKEIIYDSFDAITVVSNDHITIVQGVKASVVVKGSFNQVTNIANTLENNVLSILNNDKNSSLEYVITIPKIKNLSIKGNSKATINDFDQADDLILDVKGKAEIKVNRFSNTKLVSINVSDFAQIEMLSKFDKLETLNLNVSGEIDFKGYLLKTNVCNVIFSGSGDIKVSVKELLKAKITGEGKIFYKGYPIINTNSLFSTNGIIEQN